LLHRLLRDQMPAPDHRHVISLSPSPLSAGWLAGPLMQIITILLLLNAQSVSRSSPVPHLVRETGAVFVLVFVGGPLAGAVFVTERLAVWMSTEP
jgi:hypothetical protein